MQTYQGVLHRYQGLLDLPEHTRPVTLLEGDTPLIPAIHLAQELGGDGPENRPALPKCRSILLHHAFALPALRRRRRRAIPTATPTSARMS